MGEGHQARLVSPHRQARRTTEGRSRSRNTLGTAETRRAEILRGKTALPAGGTPVAYRAEYIWIDGTRPTAKLRSKTKIVADGETPPIWGFDGSSTNQAPGDASDCVLKPVFECPDPIRGGNNVLVMNEVLLPNMKPHPTNTRAACVKTAKKFADHEPLFGIEQEYTFLNDGRPLGWPSGGFPGPQ